MRHEHEHAQLISDLGGPAAVANRLGIPGKRSEATVWNWTRRGIPWEWRSAVADLAASHDTEVTLPDGFLRRGPVTVVGGDHEAA